MKKFVTFEGIDGSGKSTISKLVYEKLKKSGVKVILTYEPTDTKIGKYVQNCIKTGADPFVTAFTFIADRINHCEKIKKWLDEGRIVICDRYAESTYAYQSVQLQKIIDDPLKWLNDLSKDRILIPDRTYVFVISAKESLKRIKDRDELIPFEKLAFLEKVNDNYMKISKGKRFKFIDATKSIEELVDICYNDILD